MWRDRAPPPLRRLSGRAPVTFNRFGHFPGDYGEASAQHGATFKAHKNGIGPRVSFSPAGKYSGKTRHMISDWSLGASQEWDSIG